MTDARIFGGIPNAGAAANGVFTTGSPVAALPTGFDAVVQCDSLLLDATLNTNLQQVGASPLSARVSYAAQLFPAQVRNAVAPFIRPVDSALGVQHDIELRFVGPHLTGLSAGYEPPAGSIVISGNGTATLARVASGPAQGPPIEITWTVELNFVRIGGNVAGGVATLGTGASSAPAGGTSSAPAGAAGVVTGGRTAGATLGTKTAPGDSANESRVLLASGSAVTQMPASIGTRPELLQMWLEMDVAHTVASITSDDQMLNALLGASIGQDMVRGALTALTTQAGLRASPLFALAGTMTQAQVATLNLSGMRVVHAVHRPPNGHQVLSLAVNFGADSRGSTAQLQPFLGTRHFAFFVSLATLAPVVRERWRMNPSARDYVGDVQVEMPLKAGSKETGEGLARLHVSLGATLSAVTLTPFESEHGDVLQLACDETIQMLQAWYANGDEVSASDLGDLGTPVTMPFVANNAPFTPASPDEVQSSPFRAFLRYVLEPLAYPMLERFELETVDGFASAALGALLSRWSLHIARPTDGIAITTGAVNTLSV